MKQFFPAVIVGLGILAGGFGANFLKAKPASASHESGGGEAHGGGDEHGGKDEGHAKPEKKEKKDAKGGHGPKESSGSTDVTYYKFSREFVVPILDEGVVTSLVILNLYLEVDTDKSGGLFSKDPKLRDNIMTTLLGISRDGHTFDNLTDPETYETLRSMIAKNLETVIPEGLENVLIVDIAKQEV